MDKIKKIIMYGLILCIISFGNAYAVTYLYSANEISYSNTNSGLSATNVQQALDQVYSAANDYSKLRKMIYPVGSVYISVTDNTVAKVQARFGGTWVAFGSGKTLVGVNSSDTDFSTVEKTGGAKTVTLATANLPSHTHGIPSLSGTAQSSGAHTHNLNIPALSGTAKSSGAHTHSINTNAFSATSGSSGDHYHAINNTNGGGNKVNRGVMYAYNYGHGDKKYWNFNAPNMYTSNAGSHSHSLSVAAKNGAGTAVSNGAHTHSVTTNAANGVGAANSDGAHTHTVTTTADTSGATGSGTAFSIVQPYITVYMYKRKA